MTNYDGIRVGQLIDNPEFSFNAPFRICEYVDTTTEESLKNGDEPTGETIVWYDDDEDEKDIPEDIKRRWISAINIGDDGVLEIEFVRLYGEDYPA